MPYTPLTLEWFGRGSWPFDQGPGQSSKFPFKVIVFFATSGRSYKGFRAWKRVPSPANWNTEARHCLLKRRGAAAAAITLADSRASTYPRVWGASLGPLWARIAQIYSATENRGGEEPSKVARIVKETQPCRVQEAVGGTTESSLEFVVESSGKKLWPWAEKSDDRRA